MKRTTLKHRTLPDTYGHIDEFEPGKGLEIGESATPHLRPEAATYDDLLKYFTEKGHDKLVVQLLDYELITVWVIGPVAPGISDSEMKALTNPGELKKQLAGIRMMRDLAATDPLEYISQFIPPEITIDGKEYAFQIVLNHPHYDFRIYYDAVKPVDGELSFKFLYENNSNVKDLLMDLTDLRHKLEKADLLPDLYKGNGYTRELFEEHMKGEE